MGGKPGMGGVLGGCVGGAYPSMGAFRTAHEVSVDQSGMTKRTGRVTRLWLVTSFCSPQFSIRAQSKRICLLQIYICSGFYATKRGAFADLPSTQRLRRGWGIKRWWWPSISGCAFTHPSALTGRLFSSHVMFLFLNCTAFKTFTVLFCFRSKLLAPQSGAHTIAPHRDPNPSHTHTQSNPLIALEQENPEKTHDVIYF